MYISSTQILIRACFLFVTINSTLYPTLKWLEQHDCIGEELSKGEKISEDVSDVYHNYGEI